MIAVLGAGAMGAALGTHFARAGEDTVVLATERDEAAVRAWREGQPHPGLGVVLQRGIPVRDPDEWPKVLAEAGIVAVAVSSQGIEPVVSQAARHTTPGAVWAMATKGWQPETLQSPSEVVTGLLGPETPVVAIAGPGIAAEIVAGSPTALICASHHVTARRMVAHALSAPSMLVMTTSDVAGAETSSAFKNVVAIAVGIAEGVSKRFLETALVRAYANARAAMFAQGMMDMVRLAEARGGHVSTVVGLAGSGDLYVTCIGGRNGRFGQLLGSGLTPEEALRSIGSTVEGVPNTTVALELAGRHGIDLPTARAVDLALRRRLTDEHAVDQIRDLFATTMRSAHYPVDR